MDVSPVFAEKVECFQKQGGLAGVTDIEITSRFDTGVGDDFNLGVDTPQYVERQTVAFAIGEFNDCPVHATPAVVDGYDTHDEVFPEKGQNNVIPRNVPGNPPVVYGKTL
jgi:hypothetical protein